jgi:two-component system phosphate regulon sensor histidine kinase PhoR
VITSLIYLLRIIKNQKQLAEIKDDLISNITHELKTPITTISAALQALAAFSAIEDKEKTKKYLEVSNSQVNKLNKMVEKILETATLDSNNLLLKKTTIDLVDLLHSLIEKYQLINPEKTIIFNSTQENLDLSIDPFHFENAISNIVDNAVKYGGDFITLSLQLHHENLHITCQDNGAGIDKNQRHKIFDKFYRIPTGNIHNVKGFGIGLYYSKHIIEKHGGSITLAESTKETIFTVILPLDYG